MTGDDLIALALRTAGVEGVGQTALAQDSADALTLLNSILAEWQRKRWLVTNLTDLSFTSTGATTYTIGTGGNFNTVRPDRIEAAYARATYSSGANTLDFAIEEIEAPEDWADLGMKFLGQDQGAMAAKLFYDAAYPTGTLHFWPVPSTQYVLHVLVKTALGPITNTAATIALPDEYLRALIWSLSSDCIEAFALPPRPGVEMKAAGAVATIKSANFRVREMELPAVLRGPGWFGFGVRPWAGGPYIPSPGTLPTTLPSTPGMYWNNGGIVSIS